MASTVEIAMQNGTSYILRVQENGVRGIYREGRLVGQIRLGSGQEETELAQIIENDSGSSIYYTELIPEGIDPTKSRPRFCPVCRNSDGTSSKTFGDIGTYRVLVADTVSILENKGEQAAFQFHAEGIRRLSTRTCDRGRVTCENCHGMGGFFAGNAQYGYFAEECQMCGTHGHVPCDKCNGAGMIE